MMDEEKETYREKFLKTLELIEEAFNVKYLNPSLELSDRSGRVRFENPIERSNGKVIVKKAVFNVKEEVLRDMKAFKGYLAHEAVYLRKCDTKLFKIYNWFRNRYEWFERKGLYEPFTHLVSLILHPIVQGVVDMEVKKNGYGEEIRRARGYYPKMIIT